jgi:hypothetical protein
MDRSPDKLQFTPSDTRASIASSRESERLAQTPKQYVEAWDSLALAANDLLAELGEKFNALERRLERAEAQAENGPDNGRESRVGQILQLRNMFYMIREDLAYEIDALMEALQEIVDSRIENWSDFYIVKQEETANRVFAESVQNLLAAIDDYNKALSSFKIIAVYTKEALENATINTADYERRQDAVSDLHRAGINLTRIAVSYDGILESSSLPPGIQSSEFVAAPELKFPVFDDEALTASHIQQPAYLGSLVSIANNDITILIKKYEQTVREGEEELRQK